ncbi:MAG TPA: carboxypeptidase regulatory-like domain-containing protein [Pyrinomonadaceae bacterium]
MRRKGLLLAVSSLFVLLAAAARVEACTCGGPGAPCEAFGGSAAVFVGTVTDIKSGTRGAPARGEDVDWAPRTVTFSISEAFSGVEGTTVQVSTGLGGGDCGYSFVKGTTYLVYAYGAGSGERRRLSTGICTRTRLAFGATEDLEFLRGLARKPGGVTVSGRVERPQGEPGEGGARASVGMEGARVTVAGAGGQQEALTDAQGRYSLTGLPPGDYEVTLHLPETLTAYEPKQGVTVADRGCAMVSFFVTDNGRIAGRVLDATGKPVPRLNVVVVDAEGKNPEFKYGRHESTDEEGRYKFAGLPPGRYLLGVHIAGFPQPDDPTNAYARTYYPGVARAEEAEVLELRAGEELKERDLRLPPRRAESVIRGRVVWTDGTPVANAQVAYRDVTYTDTKINNAVNADERGEFTLKGYVGGAYRIEARSNRKFQGDPRRDGPMEEAPALTVTAAAPVETVTLVIRKLR